MPKNSRAIGLKCEAHVWPNRQMLGRANVRLMKQKRPPTKIKKRNRMTRLGHVMQFHNLKISARCDNSSLLFLERFFLFVRFQNLFNQWKS